jgi:hypothetical protein
MNSKIVLPALAAVCGSLLVARPAHASQPFCCTSDASAAGSSCVPATGPCAPSPSNTDPFAWGATVWADGARIDLEPAGLDTFGVAIWWIQGTNVVTDRVGEQNIHIEATNQDTTKPVTFCFNEHNPYATPTPITETIHVAYSPEFANNYTTPALNNCVGATIDPRFVTQVPAVPRAGVFGLFASLGLAGCFFGVRSIRRRVA